MNPNGIMLDDLATRPQRLPSQRVCRAAPRAPAVASGARAPRRRNFPRLVVHVEHRACLAARAAATSTPCRAEGLPPRYRVSGHMHICPAEKPSPRRAGFPRPAISASPSRRRCVARPDSRRIDLRRLLSATAAVMLAQSLVDRCAGPRCAARASYRLLSTLGNVSRQNARS